MEKYMTVQVNIETTKEQFNDWAMKAHALRVTLNQYVNNIVEYTNNPPVLPEDGLVDIQIDITPDETYTIAMAAHIKNKTFNDYIVQDVLMPVIEEQKKLEEK